MTTTSPRPPSFAASTKDRSERKRFPRIVVRIGILRALASRNYRIYAEGNAISMIGTWVQRVAVGWLAWDLTQSTMWLGLIAFAELLPTVLIGLFAGVIADRFNRLRLFKISQILAMSQAAALCVLTFTNLISIEILFALTLYLGAIYGFSQPIRLSLVPSLIRRSDLHAAIACNSLLFNIARFIGPILAGLIIISWGIAPAFAINMATYVILLYCASLLNPRNSIESQKKNSGIIREILDGVLYAFNHPAIRTMLILFAFTAAFGRPFAELLPGFSAGIYQKGALGLAWLTSATGLGAILAGIYLSQRRTTDGLRELILLNTGLFGVALITLVATNWFWVAVFSVTLAGFSMVICAVGAQSLIQEAVDGNMRGRVLSLYGFVFRTGVAIGSLTIGTVASEIGLPWPVRIGAFACVVAAFIMWRRLRPNIR